MPGDDDDRSLRGPDGSPSDPGGLVGPQGSAPASSREILIRHLDFALAAFKDDENAAWWLNMALLAVEGGIQAWRAETPLERPPGPPLGRPKVVDDDAQKLLDLRAVNPGSNCRTDFETTTGVGNQRARIRYQAADARVAELLALMTSPSGKSS